MKIRLVSVLVELLYTMTAWGSNHTFTTNTSISCNDLTYENFDITVSGCVLTIDCLHHFNSLSVISGGSVTHAAGDTNGLYLNVATDVTINAGCSIQANGCGYAAGTGPGAGTTNGSYGGGGSYGGNGSDGYVTPSGAAYGNLTAPVLLGSGGGGTSLPGAGGGSVHLVVTNSLLVDGALSSDGISTTGISAGGSGGSVYVQCGTLTGNGSINANGGNGQVSYSGGGGGGRVALYYTSSSFIGTMTACGGDGYSNIYGGAGTIYTKAAAASLGDLTLSNCAHSGAITPLMSALPSCNVYTASSANVLSTASLTVSGLLHIGTTSELWAQVGAAITISAASATIDSAGTLIADGRGYAPGTGPGAGASNGGYGGGGGFGGNGSDGYVTPGGTAYGDLTAPVDMGSGGGGTAGPGTGGGAVHLIVTNALLINGTLSVNGGNTSSLSGGGAGGSIYIQCNSIGGNGSISANGGNGQVGYSGGGSGGRVALYYTTNTFTGALTACGGNGYSGVYGGAGTIYTKASAAGLGNLSVSNCGQSPAMTPLSTLPACNVSITSAAKVLTAASLAVSGSLHIGSTSEVWAPTGVATTISAASATIDSAGKLLADACGYAPDTGPGAGASNGGYGGGGGNGGNGSDGYVTVGGTAYGDLTAPIDMGSGGGGTAGPGTGGGAVHLIVTNALLINGTLSVNGSNTSNLSGGGAGGSIYIQCNSIGGNGSLSANGGNGQVSYSGGGSGGRIALYYTTNTFTGASTACGGIGYSGVYGGAGTIYTKAVAASMGNLSVNNCGQSAAMTPLSTLPACNVSITSGAKVLSAAALTVSGSLHIGTTSEVWAPVGVAITISAASATIDSAGKLLADACGYAPGAGPGVGGSNGGYGGGGAYGGNGGNGASGVGGGMQYDVPAWPSWLGSGGGGTAAPGTGGGSMHLFVTNALLLNGSVSANGTSTGNISGGGAGGSILIHCASLGGNGSISANGGNGYPGYSGGGSGGRVAFYYCSGSFPADSVKVNGGGGISAGDPGTIWWGNGDLNHNSIPDGCDIESGTSTDCNHNGIPDEVEISGNSTKVTIEFNNTHSLLLRWPCIPGYANYQLWGKHGNTADALLGTVSGGVYDATSLLGGSDPQFWTFYVIGIQ